MFHKFPDFWIWKVSAGRPIAEGMRKRITAICLWRAWWENLGSIPFHKRQRKFLRCVNSAAIKPHNKQSIHKYTYLLVFNWKMSWQLTMNGNVFISLQRIQCIHPDPNTIPIHSKFSWELQCAISDLCSNIIRDWFSCVVVYWFLIIFANPWTKGNIYSSLNGSG